MAAQFDLSEPKMDVWPSTVAETSRCGRVGDLVGEPESTVYISIRSAIDEVSREMRPSERVGPRTSSIPPARMLNILLKNATRLRGLEL